ncbi:MAG TPA: hypothetical protein VN812_15165 [Candidatus Acidoferrales bacterium]|nr:hypothetical protein [Candidatus Acidoferrales bacterium]
MKPRGLAVAGLALLGLLSCTARRPVSLPLTSSDPTTIFAIVRQREAQIVTLRARFTADSRRGDEQHSADGVLLVKKPDRFRLRLMLPLGLTVFDYVSWGPHARMSLPLENRVASDPTPDSHLAFSQEDLAQAFLRGSRAFPGTCTPSNDDTAAVVVVCRDAPGTILRRIRIDAHGATPLDETSFEAGQPRMTIRYGDYRMTGDMLLPYRIALQYPEQRVSLDISIERYEVNPRLPDELFQPPPSGGS